VKTPRFRLTIHRIFPSALSSRLGRTAVLDALAALERDGVSGVRGRVHEEAVGEGGVSGAAAEVVIANRVDIDCRPALR
jgi:hypothetical protein